MYLTETVSIEYICTVFSCVIRFHRRQYVDWLKQQKKRVLTAGVELRSGKIERIECIHMSEIKGKVSFYASAVFYLAFNLRLGVDSMTTLKATAWQILQTAPYVAGIAYVVIALLQYMAGGEKVPWDRRLRLFFAIGILAGLVYGIYEYAGQGGVTP